MTIEFNDIAFLKIKSPSSFNMLSSVIFSNSVTRSSSTSKLNRPPTSTSLSSHFYFNWLPRIWPTYMGPDQSSSCSDGWVDNAPCWWEAYSRCQVRWQTSDNSHACSSITGKYLAPQLIYVQRKDATLPSSSDLSRRMTHLAFRQSLVQWKYSTMLWYIEKSAFLSSIKNAKLWSSRSRTMVSFCLTVFEGRQLMLWSHYYTHIISNSTKLYRQTSTNGWVHQQANEAWNEE